LCASYVKITGVSAFNDKEIGVASNQRGSSSIELPNDLDIVITRQFEAPVALVFDALTKPDLVRKTMAPFGETVKECTIDLRVGGSYRSVFEPDGGPECVFTGTFLEVEPPTRSVQTWRFGGWPDVEAVETTDLHEADGVTTMTYRMSFRDQAGRDHMTTFDGLQSNFDQVDNLLRSLVEADESTAE
jgi:uncharacterized protein YndB with AHSA1/START domain